MEKLSIRKSAFTTIQKIGLVLGPALFFLIQMAPVEGLSPEGKSVLAVLAWVVTWWVTEPLTIGAVSLLPVVLLPLLQTISTAVASKAYADSMNFLFLGGFALALTMERWNLHERIALNIIAFFGGSLPGIQLGILTASFVISMWVSNAATSMMLLPIATAITGKVVALMKEEGVWSEKDEKNFSTATILNVSLGSIFGGSATLIGTPTNVLLAGFVPKLLNGYEITFGSWMIFATPMCLLMMLFCAFYTTKFAFKTKVKRLKAGKTFIQDELKKLGPMSSEEKLTAILFTLAIFFWLTRTILWSWIPNMSDAMISITVAVLCFAIPSKTSKEGRLLGPDAFSKMPWGILIMIGGGYSIAAAFSATDLSKWLGDQMLVLEGHSYLFVLVASCLFTLVITQVAPNTATGTIMIPISCAVAQAVGVNPIPVMTATALGAGFAIMMPIGTPNLGIVYASGKVSMRDMLTTGAVLTVANFVIIISFIYFVLPVTLGVNPMMPM